MKTCSLCKIIKQLDEFKPKHSKCIPCTKLYLQEYNKRNSEKHRKRKAEYYQNNKEYFRLKTKKWVSINKEKYKLSQKLYNIKNKERFREYRKNYVKNRYKNDPKFALVVKLRSRLKGGLKKKQWLPNTHFAQYIGCSQDQLMKHIENQFTEGMSWDKVTSGEIQIDHHIPLISACSVEEMYKLSHYTNLAPLWTQANIAKNDKYDPLEKEAFLNSLVNTNIDYKKTPQDFLPKPILSVSIIDGSIKRYPNTISTKLAGFAMSSVYTALKTGQRGQGYYWYYDNKDLSDKHYIDLTLQKCKSFKYHFNKPIQRIDNTGVIKVYDNINEISADGFKIAEISRCLTKSDRKGARGYQWKLVS